MSISGIEGVGGFTPFVPQTVPGVGAVGGAGAAGGPQGPSGPSGVGSDFGDLVLDGLDRLEGVQDRADKLSVQAATGDLAAMHDYTIAATEAAVTTQLTVAVRNKALEAFNEIMRMQV